MKIHLSRQVLRLLPVTFAVMAAGLVSGAEPAPLDTLTDVAQIEIETAVNSAPNYLGLELPLRPGERVVATAGGECSVVVFAPNKERDARFAAYWSTARWDGYCRFGLAYGKGVITGVDGNWSVETAMLYGIEVNPAESINTEVGQDGAISWDPSIDTLHFFSGPAFSDLAAKRYVIQLEKDAPGDLELGDLVSGWYGADYLEKHTFDEAGRERTMSVSAWNVDTYCGLGLPPEFKPYEKEVKKACRKTGDKLVLFRREGFGIDPWASRPITWLKSCPFNKTRRTNDCGQLVREALGKEAAELDAFLKDGDAAARAAARQEIIDRYAPLEAAIEEPLLVEDFE
ncbi:MAG: hypothetical protein WEA77_10875 [Hyphomonas sp.]|uniref:hypothetical protein n=1 Tax=Hyphomonas sp. TaxID=87 RepID=UPI0034A0049D